MQEVCHIVCNSDQLENLFLKILNETSQVLNRSNNIV